MRDEPLPSSPMSGGFNSGFRKPPSQGWKGLSQASLLFCSPSQPAVMCTDHTTGCGLRSALFYRGNSTPRSHLWLTALTPKMNPPQL